MRGLQLIDELTAILKDEQAEDDKKKDWCEAELDKHSVRPC